MSLGGATPPEDLGTMLPFPPEQSVFGGTGLNINPATAKVFFELVAAGSLPNWAAADLVKYAVAWKKLI